MKLIQLIRPLLLTACLSGCGLLPAATLVVSNTATAPAPDNLAYNLGHFFPGSNTADWWRYSRVSGARIFLVPSHFSVSGTVRPGDASVTNQTAFLARRTALRADPLNTDYINWPVILPRFDSTLSGNNKIVPNHALGAIHRLGGRILAQMTLSTGSFPISGESDWYGKWTAWRTFYSVAFHLAREFDVERFTMFNEPNHSASFIEPDQWLMRLRLCSDAVDCAIADVNRLYGKALQPRFAAPVTAGASGVAFTDYGRPAVESIQTDFLGQTLPGNRLFHLYAYQQYNQTPANFAKNYVELREAVDFFKPAGVEPLPFAITEFNVHTGATYDTLAENADTLSKAVRLGAIVSRLTAAGMEELYMFKFGMTVYSNNFPVQKNGMLYADNSNAPYNHGTMSRSAEVWRLFNKGLAPGRELLAFTASGLATDLALTVSRDPVTGFHYIFSSNETGSAIPLEIDLSALGLPDGNRCIIEDVSQWRRGIVRSVERLQDGLLNPGNQPGQSVWLITIPGEPQRVSGSDDGLLALPVSADAVVRDGVHAATNFGSATTAWARNDPAAASARAAAFLQFDLPGDWDPDDLQLALLSVPVAAINGGSDTVHAHLYGIDNHDWREDTLTWNNAPNLRKGAPAGNQIRHGVVQDAGNSAHVLAQLTVSGGYTVRQVDVTDYLVRQQGGKASFLIAQDPRWDVDINVTEVPSSWSQLASGDTQPDGLLLRTREGASASQPAASLVLIRNQPRPVGYDAWIAAAFPGVTDPAIVGTAANPARDGLPNLLKFALGMDPRVPAVLDAPAVTGAGVVQFNYTRNLLGEGVSLTLEGSSNLAQWWPVTTVTSLGDDGLRESLRAEVNLAAGVPVFLRLEAIAAPQ